MIIIPMQWIVENMHDQPANLDSNLSRSENGLMANFLPEDFAMAKIRPFHDQEL